MKIAFLLIICLFSVIASLGSSTWTYGLNTKINNDISKEIKQEVKSICSDFVKNIREGDFTQAKSLFSDELLKKISREHSDRIFEKLNKLFSEHQFEISNEYYSTIAQVNPQRTVPIIPSLNDDFMFIINNAVFFTKQKYNLFFITKNQGIQYLMFLSLGKYSKGWLIDTFHAGDYAINNSTAPLLIDKAKDCCSKDELIAAAIYLDVAKKLMRPAPYLQYPKEGQYLSISEQIIKKTNVRHSFPITVNNENQIVGISNIITKEGISPIVNYITKVNLTDSANVKKEAEVLMKITCDRYPEFRKNFSYVMMRAYNEMPADANKKYNCYNSIFKLN